MLSEKEIISLIKMLDDPDVSIADNIITALSNTDKKTIPLMEDIWDLSLDELVQERITFITSTIRANEAISFFQHWITEPEPKVLEAWFCINEMCNNHFDLEEVLDFINKLRFDAWKEMNDNLSTLEKCNILAFLFQKRIKFTTTSPKQDPAFPYLFPRHTTEDEEPASQTAAGLLFQEIARLLDIDLFGLNVFEYAVLGYLNPEVLEKETPKTDDVLFYLIFSDKISFVGNHQLDFGNKEKDLPTFKIATPAEIIGKILYGLIRSYRQDGNEYLEKLCVKIYEIIT